MPANTQKAFGLAVLGNGVAALLGRRASYNGLPDRVGPTPRWLCRPKSSPCGLGACGHAPTPRSTAGQRQRSWGARLIVS
jgi:hypothetical protein